jgi:hypothetical protein
LYRVYLPPGDDFGAVPLPTLTFEESSGSQTVQPCSSPSPATEATPPSDNIPSGAELYFVRPAGTHANFPNPDSGYLWALVTPPGPGQVVVISAKAPTHSSGNFPSAWPVPGTDMRYWSMCTYLDTATRPLVENTLADGTTDYGCRDDQETALNADGYYTYVVGTEAQRAQIDHVRGATFLPFSTADPATEELLMLRNMLASSSFTEDVQSVPPDGNPVVAADVMGAYYPKAAVCSLSTLITQGAQACLAGAATLGSGSSS